VAVDSTATRPSRAATKVDGGLAGAGGFSVTGGGVAGDAAGFAFRAVAAGVAVAVDVVGAGLIAGEVPASTTVAGMPARAPVPAVVVSAYAVPTAALSRATAAADQTIVRQIRGRRNDGVRPAGSDSVSRGFM
jgi:hypothetical protein